MLVLSRKPTETIKILYNGVEIEINVFKIIGNRVQIGIDAPKEVRIVRGELEIENQTSTIK